MTRVRVLHVVALLLSIPLSSCESPPDASPSTQCSTAHSGGLAACVEQTRYAADVQVIAQPRVPGSTHWQAVQDLCARTFEENGFSVERQRYGSGVNVIGTRAGASEPERSVVISAHYDHIEGCDGADDNATGVAGVLEAARVLGGRAYPRTLTLACWDEEELGLLGTRAYVRERVSQSSVAVAFVLDAIGFRSDEPNSQELPMGLDALFPDQAREIEANGYRGDFITLIGDESANPQLQAMERQGQAIGLRTSALLVPATLKNLDLLADLRRSDHAAFWEADVPAIAITDSANFRNPGYHCLGRPDTVDTLDMQFGSQVVAITVGAAAESLGIPPNGS